MTRVKLSNDQVVEIRRLYRNGDLKQVALAARFGVTQHHISNIVNFKRRAVFDV